MKLRLAAPLYVVWETTLDCNAQCVHCYSDATFGRNTVKYWPTQDALALIDDLAESGVIILAFSGGEFLLREDWEELTARAVKRGLRVTMATNGRLVSSPVAERLKTLGVSNVTVSIDAASAALHDKIRGSQGMFDAACAAVTRLATAGVRVTVNFTPMKPNFREAKEVAALAYRLGAAKANLTEYVYLSRGGLGLMLGPDELKEVIDCWLKLGEEYRGRLEIDWHDCRVALLLPPEQAEPYTGCGAGYTHCRITVNREVTPCVVLPYPVGNLSNAKFLEIWRSAPALEKIRDRANIREGNCSVCEHQARCGGCRAVSFAHYGHPFGADPTCWIVREKPSTSSDIPLHTTR